MKINTGVVYLFVVGFYSILGQVVILRELNVTFYGIELIYLLSFTFWMLGTAVGATLGRRSYIPTESNILSLLLLSSILLIADLVFIRGIRNILGGVPGGYLPFSLQISGLIIALLPIGLLAGLLFQWTAKKFVSENRTLAKAYAIESAGGIVGGLSSTLLLEAGISNFLITLICVALCLLAVIYFSFKFKMVLIKLVSFFLFFLIIISFVFSYKFDLLLTSWNYSGLVGSVDTPYNRVTITSFKEQVNVFEDGALSYETQGIAAEEFVQLATLQTTDLDNVLVLGGGFGGIIFELLKLPVKKIDYVEINKNLLSILTKSLPAGLSNSLKNNRVNIIYDDPRKFLKNDYHYNVILVAMPEPMSLQNNRYYTKQFFNQCFNSLNEKGVLAFKIPSSENIWTQQLTDRNSGIYEALKSSFKYVLVLPGVTNLFIASKSELTTNVNVLTERFKERSLETKLVSPQYINYIFTNDRFAEIQKLISHTTTNANSDFQPVCFSYTVSIWLSKFFPNLTFSENLLQSINKSGSIILILVVLIFLLGIILIMKKSQSAKRIFLVFLAGFIGMILEVILILLYQNTNGILFRDIGLLLMAFMVGLTLGSFLIDKFFTVVENQINTKVLIGRLLFIGLAILIMMIYLGITGDIVSSLPVIFIAILINGLFVSGIFAFVSLYKVEEQQKVISQLYSSDLIGGALGSLIASLIFIPVFGYFLSLIFIAVLSLYCLLNV
jgi:spermidine synthase